MNIYCSNLSHNVAEEDLAQAFGAYGQVEGVTIVESESGVEGGGFGIVDMSTEAEAEAAIAGLNGTEIKGQSLKLGDRRALQDRRESESRRAVSDRRDRPDRRRNE